MWLVTTLVAAVGSTSAWLFVPKKYKLGFLSLMLWGASIMILVDHILGYDGGEFISMTTEGLITNSAVLGIVMLVPIFAIWQLSVILSIKRGGK
ncbi:MAG: hypothetical protein DRO99_02930 [Candidatus Aenigmatarchaeota archaeon]|nr:MAG: hypothetical protein DRO99_02930 [Candidatus Aenigmarchaeota archaeon]